MANLLSAASRPELHSRLTDGETAVTHHTKRRRYCLPCICALAALVALFSWRLITTSAHVPLRVAINPWPGYEFAALARAKGFFEEAGVDVKLLELSSLGDTRRTFERGQVDGFFGTIVELIESRHESDRRAEIALISDYSCGSDLIVARAPIATVADLRGKKIGIEKGTLTAVMLMRALEQAGMTWDDVDPIHYAAIDMPEAFAMGEIDAAVVYPPVSMQIVNAHDTNIVFSSASIPGEIVDVLVFDESVLKSRRREVDAFVHAYHRAQEYAQQYPDESYRIMAARERISAEEFADALRNGVHIVYRSEQDAFMKHGKLESAIQAAERAMQIEASRETLDLKATDRNQRER